MPMIPMPQHMVEGEQLHLTCLEPNMLHEERVRELQAVRKSYLARFRSIHSDKIQNDADLKMVGTLEGVAVALGEGYMQVRKSHKKLLSPPAKSACTFKSQQHHDV